jgi:quercetin dioxygenase-like cupin family protein
MFRIRRKEARGMGTQAAVQPAGQDPVRVDAGHYTIELENERVRVLRIRYGPREKSQMHAHPALVGVMLTDASLRFTYPDGRTEDIEGKAGQVLSFPAHEHLPENLSDRPFEAVIVELKG